MPEPCAANVDATLVGDTYLIRVSGDLGPPSLEELELALGAAESSPATRILLDLQRLGSLDAAALHVILKASRRSATNGDRLRVTRGNGDVAHLFRLTALDQALPLTDGGSRRRRR